MTKTERKEEDAGPEKENTKGRRKCPASGQPRLDTLQLWGPDSVYCLPSWVSWNWNTAWPALRVVCGCFLSPTAQVKWSGDRTRPTKSRTLTLWPFAEKAGQLRLSTHLFRRKVIATGASTNAFILYRVLWELAEKLSLYSQKIIIEQVNKKGLWEKNKYCHSIERTIEWRKSQGE